MTTIAAVRRAGKIVMASDSQVTDDDYYTTYCNDKIWVHDGIIIGAAGNSREIYALQHFEWGDTPDWYMMLQFAVDMQNYFDSYEIHDQSMTALIGVNGIIYRYDAADQEVTRESEYCSIGSGAPFARAILWYTRSDWDTEKRLRSAVQAAQLFDSQTGGDIVIRSVNVSQDD